MKILTNNERLNLIDDLKKAQYSIGTIDEILLNIKRATVKEVKIDTTVLGNSEFPRLPVSTSVFKKMLESEKVELETTIANIISKLHSSLDIPREGPDKTEDDF